MTRAFLLVLCLMLFGCDDASHTAEYAMKHLTYIRDSRTGLCFAFFWGGSDGRGGPGFTTVPCEMVLDYLPKYPAHEKAEP